MIMINESGKTHSLICQRFATGRQKNIFRLCCNKYLDRFISGKVSITLLVINYRTSTGNIIEAIYNEAGILIFKHYYNENNNFLFTKYFM